MQHIHKNIASFCINISSSYFMLAAINTGIASTTNTIALGSTVLNIICAILYFRVAIFFDMYEWVYTLKPLVSALFPSFAYRVILVAFIVKKEYFR